MTNFDIININYVTAYALIIKVRVVFALPSSVAVAPTVVVYVTNLKQKTNNIVTECYLRYNRCSYLIGKNHLVTADAVILSPR